MRENELKPHWDCEKWWAWWWSSANLWCLASPHGQAAITFPDFAALQNFINGRVLEEQAA